MGISSGGVIHRRAETDLWVGSPRGEQGYVSRFGHLVFEERVSPPRRVELLPYTLVRREGVAASRPEHAVQGGLDVRVGLGTAATLSATVNPDFAQVEQDPAVLAGFKRSSQHVLMGVRVAVR